MSIVDTLTNEVKALIIKGNIQRIAQEIFSSELNAKVMQRIGRDVKQAQEAIVDLYKLAAEMEKELAALIPQEPQK